MIIPPERRRLLEDAAIPDAHRAALRSYAQRAHARHGGQGAAVSLHELAEDIRAHLDASAQSTTATRIAATRAIVAELLDWGLLRPWSYTEGITTYHGHRVDWDKLAGPPETHRQPLPRKPQAPPAPPPEPPAPPPAPQVAVGDVVLYWETERSYPDHPTAAVCTEHLPDGRVRLMLYSTRGGLASLRVATVRGAPGGPAPCWTRRAAEASRAVSDAA